MHNDPKDSIREGYELQDIRPRAAVVAMVILGAMLLGGIVVIIIVMRGFDTGAAYSRVETSPLYSPAAQQPPAGSPALQRDPVADRIAFQAAEQARVDGYGWASTDPAMKRAHIPVAKAMALLASGAAPYRQEPTSAALQNTEQRAHDEAGLAAPAAAPAAPGEGGH